MKLLLEAFVAEMVENRFLILDDERARHGGLSVVRKAMDVNTREYVAVKYVQAPTDSLTRKIFERETKTLRALAHPNIVRLLAAGLDETETYFLVLPWLERSLADVLDESGPFSWQNVMEQVALQLSAGLAHAHLRQVEHRDIKPGNVLIASDGQPVLADFGIGKLRGPAPTELTVQAFRSGIYAPPELEATLPYVRDVYSMGVLLIQSMYEATLRDYHELEPAVAALTMPANLRNLLTRCIDPDPTCRPANGSVLLNELQSIMEVERRAGAAEASVAFLQLTNAARAQLVPEGDRRDADGVLLRDLTNMPIAEFRFDHERADHDASVIFVSGDRWRLTLRPQLDAGELVVTGAREQEYEVLEAARRRGLPIGGWLTWTTKRPLNEKLALNGLDLLMRSLQDFYASKLADADVDSTDVEADELLDAWGRVLQAREDLARGELRPLSYTDRRAHGRELVLTLGEPVEVDLVGTEWEVRPLGGRFVSARGEVVVQAGQQLTLIIKGRVGTVPSKGTLTPHLGPSQVALQRQQDAVESVKNGSGARPELKALVATPAGAKPPRAVDVTSWHADLDSDKKRAVSAALGADDLFVVKGPPGTGKTSFITELVSQYLRRKPEARVLIVSQTHVAVDNALERLDAAGIKGVVRLGQPDDPRVAAACRHLLLDQQMTKWAATVRDRAEANMARRAQDVGVDQRHLRAALALQRLVTIRHERDRVEGYLGSGEGDESTGLATTLGLDIDSAELQQRLDALADQERELFESAEAELAGDLTLRSSMGTEDARAAVDVLLGHDERTRQLLRLVELQAEWLQRVTSDVNLAGAFLQTTRVIAGTCLGFLRHRAVRDLDIDLCVLDEASKATATEALVPLARAKTSVLVGDTSQLPPLDEDLLRRQDLLDEHAVNADLIQETLFARLADRLPPECQQGLTEQYRMIRPIGDLISTCFYNGELHSARNDGLEGYALLGKPVLWLDTSQLGERRLEDAEGGAGSSFANRAEAAVVMDRLKLIDTAVGKGHVKLRSGSQTLDVLLIAPYRSQVAELRRRLASFRSETLQVDVESVDAVQGREADLAIFSVTRSNPGARMGFLGQDYWRRINVALSRARFGLTIVGDAEFCRSAPGALRRVLQYMQENESDCELRAAAGA